MVNYYPYRAHSRDPWFHSWYSPIRRINRKSSLIIVHEINSDVFIIIVIGSRITISTSKIRKITAIRKNRNENGIRADLFGSNPHSKGDLFSRSSIDFFDSIVAINIIIVDNRRIIIIAVIVFMIIYLVLQTSWLEVNYTFYIR